MADPKLEPVATPQQHPLARNWHSFVQVNDTFVPQGDMDLSNMTPDGDLSNGTHTQGTARPEPLTGEAKLVLSPLGGTGFVVSLQTERASYNGLLVFEAGERAIIVGAVRLNEESDQNDGVWVITKP